MCLEGLFVEACGAKHIGVGITELTKRIIILGCFSGTCLVVSCKVFE